MLPRRSDLPELKVTNTLGELADQYAAKLMEAGRSAEAQVILDFWCKAMDFNWMRLDAHSSLLLQQFGDKLLGEGTAEEWVQNKSEAKEGTAVVGEEPLTAEGGEG